MRSVVLLLAIDVSLALSVTAFGQQPNAEQRMQIPPACTQPDDICGPGCTVSCPEEKIAYCQGSERHPTNTTGAFQCLKPPTCECK
jgi:hypothetical protein